MMPGTIDRVLDGRARISGTAASLFLPRWEPMRVRCLYDPRVDPFGFSIWTIDDSAPWRIHNEWSISLELLDKAERERGWHGYDKYWARRRRDVEIAFESLEWRIRLPRPGVYSFLRDVKRIMPADAELERRTDAFIAETLDAWSE